MMGRRRRARRDDRQDDRRGGGGGNPWDHPENYIRHSPRNGLAANAKTPSLLLHGANDFDHNHEIWQILSDRGVPVKFVTYPREGHGIRVITEGADEVNE